MDKSLDQIKLFNEFIETRLNTEVKIINAIFVGNSVALAGLATLAKDFGTKIGTPLYFVAALLCLGAFCSLACLLIGMDRIDGVRRDLIKRIFEAGLDAEAADEMYRRIQWAYPVWLIIVAGAALAWAILILVVSVRF